MRAANEKPRAMAVAPGSDRRLGRPCLLSLSTQPYSDKLARWAAERGVILTPPPGWIGDANEGGEV